MFNKQSEFVAHASAVNCLSIGPYTQNLFATGGEDTVVHIWNTDSQNVWKLNGNKSPIECVCFNPNEEYCASGARSGSIKIFDMNEGKVARNLRGHQTTTNCLHYHPHADILVSGSIDTQVKAWDLRNKECLMTCPGHDKQVSCVRFSPDGRWLVTSALDGKILFWDVVAGKIFHTLKCGSGSHALQIEFSPTELYLAVSTSARVCCVYDCENNFECIATTPAESSQIRRISFSNQGRCVCVATDGCVRVYELPNNSYYHQISNGESAIFSCLSAIKTNWDKIADLKLNEQNYLLGGSFNSNFVSLYGGDFSEVCGESGESQEEQGEDYGDEKQGDYDSKSTNDDYEQGVRQRQSAIASAKTRITTAQTVRDSKQDCYDDEDNYVYGNQRPIPVESEEKDTDLSNRKDYKEDNETDSKVHQPMGRMKISSSSRDQNVVTPRKLPSSDSRVDNTPPSVGRLHTGSRITKSSHSTPDVARSKPATASPAFEAKADIISVVGNKHAGLVPSSSAGIRSSPSAHAPAPMDHRKAGLRLNLGVKRNDGSSSDSAGGGSAHKGELILSKLIENHISDGRDFSSKLSHRLSSLRILQQYWNDGEISQVISEINMMYESNRALTLTCRNSLQANEMKDVSKYILDADSHQMLVHESKQPIMIIADFLIVVDGFKPLISTHQSSGLSLDICVSMLPILDNMLNDSSLEHVIRASVLTVSTLFDAFGDMIHSTTSDISIRGGAPAAGVDLMQEERIRKCSVCMAELKKICSRVKALRRMATGSSGGTGSSNTKKYNSVTTSELSRLDSKLATIL